MNDDELITLVREQRTTVPMTTPVDEIISRGRAVRARRRIPGVAGALALTAGVAVAAVAALVPGSHQAPGAQLAAWTVTRQANGDVDVTIRQLRDRTGLAAALHADGVPAYIAFADPAPASCPAYPGAASTLRAIYQFQQGNGSAVLVIHPSAIPGGAGLFIMDVPATSSAPFPVIAGRAVHIGLVSGSQRCPLTGPSRS